MVVLCSHPPLPGPNPLLPQPAHNASSSARRVVLAPSADESPAPEPGPEETQRQGEDKHTLVISLWPFSSPRTPKNPKVLQIQIFESHTENS